MTTINRCSVDASCWESEAMLSSVFIEGIDEGTCVSVDDIGVSVRLVQVW